MFSPQQMVMLWKILFFMILFYSLVNLFYFNFYFMFSPWCYYTHDVMGDYICEVIRCYQPLVSWQMEQPILFFIIYVEVTDVMSQGQMLLALIIYYCHMVHGIIAEPCGSQGGHQALVLWAVI